MWDANTAKSKDFGCRKTLVCNLYDTEQVTKMTLNLFSQQKIKLIAPISEYEIS